MTKDEIDTLLKADLLNPLKKKEKNLIKKFLVRN